MSITAQEFQQGMDAWEAERVARAKRCGPCYGGSSPAFTPFFDQYFERDLEPVGVVNCSQALRVGSTQHSLEVLLLACPNNESELLFPAGSTITLNFLEGDSEEGTFEDVGPSICVKAPAAGMKADAGHVVARFPLPDFDKPWLMVNVEFSGAITGGKCDCVLNLVAR